MFGESSIPHTHQASAARQQVAPAAGEPIENAADRPSTPNRASVGDSGAIPPMPTPIGLLRGGFIGTTLASVGFLLVGQAMSAASIMEPERAMVAWIWATLAASVGSIFAVRSIARRRHARNHQGLRGAVRRAAAGAAESAAKACSWAGAATATCARRGAHVGVKGVQWTAQKAGALDNRFGIKDRVHRCAAGAWDGACAAAKRVAASIGTPVTPASPAPGASKAA